jgi:hypothetical protein
MQLSASNAASAARRETRRRPWPAPGTTDRRRYSPGGQNHAYRTFGTRLTADPPKYGMTQHRPPVVPEMSAGFITIRYPSREHRTDSPPVTPDWFRAVVVRRSERYATTAYWDLLSRLLIQHGHHVLLDRIGYDADHGWQILFIASEPEAVVLLHQMAGKECGPDRLTSFDRREIVADWLDRLKGRLAMPNGEAREPDKRRSSRIP